MDDEDDADGKVMVMQRRPASMRDLLGLPTGQVGDTEGNSPDYAPPAKKSDPLPKPGDPYRACAQFLNRLATEQRLIHFVDRHCFSKGFSYHDLRSIDWRDSDDPGSGPVLVLRFIAAAITEVEIHGRNLDDIRYYIGEGLMPWVWEQPERLKNKELNVVVIDRILFTEIKKIGKL
jgi:hypothetical protein